MYKLFGEGSIKLLSTHDNYDIVLLLKTITELIEWRVALQQEQKYQEAKRKKKIVRFFFFVFDIFVVGMIVKKYET